jgi:predicted metal-binding protein
MPNDLNEGGVLSKYHIIPKRILDNIPLSKIKQDLEKYRSLAINLGAYDAVIVSSEEVIIDERVRAKCMYPKCSQYGTSINCPPYVPDINFMKKVISKYQYAVLFSVKGEIEHFIKPDFYLKFGGMKNPARVLLNQICSEIESRSYYDGYYLSIAFGQGPCKSLWCPDQTCAAIQPGSGCRFPLKSRSSMEAVGMDVFRMASRQGWEIYPCGEKIEKGDIPHVLLVGLVLIY